MEVRREHLARASVLFVARRQVVPPPRVGLEREPFDRELVDAQFRYS